MTVTNSSWIYKTKRSLLKKCFNVGIVKFKIFLLLLYVLVNVCSTSKKYFRRFNRFLCIWSEITRTNIPIEICHKNLFLTISNHFKEMVILIGWWFPGDKGQGINRDILKITFIFHTLQEIKPKLGKFIKLKWWKEFSLGYFPNFVSICCRGLKIKVNV